VTSAPPSPVELDFSIIEEVDTDSRIIPNDLPDLTAFVLAQEGATGPWGITVALVDDARLQKLHREFMGIDEPTDIMTFPSDDPSGPSGGELVISLDHALTRAGDWGNSPAAEIRFLVTHGLLHLLGWRDETDEHRQRMLHRQHELIDQWQSRPECAARPYSLLPTDGRRVGNEGE
jgi:probable rRNA maturation factor